MSSFYLSFKDMLKDFGVDIKVYPYKSPADKPHYHYVGGIKVPDSDGEEVEPELRHEPVLPVSDMTAMMPQFLPGGIMQQGDLVWYSTGVYPENTRVDVPSQGGMFRVMPFSNYKDYSDVVIYELKGDDKHSGG